MEYLDTDYVAIYAPLWWHKQGLQQTATGYGSKLTTPWLARLPDGRERRIYCTCWSNSGSCWITLNRQTIWLGEPSERIH